MLKNDQTYSIHIVLTIKFFHVSSVLYMEGLTKVFKSHLILKSRHVITITNFQTLNYALKFQSFISNFVKPSFCLLILLTVIHKT